MPGAVPAMGSPVAMAIPSRRVRPAPAVLCRLPGLGVIFSVMDPTQLTIAQFQRHIFDRYDKVDRARGTPLTWMWFIEEVGELSHALARGEDRANIEEEFADVFAWLCTLANINDVDLAAAIARKYLDNPPEGHK